MKYQQQQDIEGRLSLLSVEDLTDLFILNKINDGQSMNKVKSLGDDYGLARKLNSDIKQGLGTEADVQRNRESFGDNIPVEKEPTTLCELIMECLEDTMLRILLLAALVSTVIGIINEGLATGWTEGATIFFAIFLIISITAGNNYLKEKQFRQLRRRLDDGKCQVIRGNKVTEIATKDLVVGDILLFNLGDLFVVDGLMIQGSAVKMDESAMTGESDEIKKLPYQEMAQQKQQQFESRCCQRSHQSIFNIRNQMLRWNSLNASSSCWLEYNLWTVKKIVDSRQSTNSIIIEIRRIIVSIFTFFALMGHLGYDIYLGQIQFKSLKTLQVIVESFMISVTIIVVAVPEGLPLAVTIALAYSVGKMKDEQNLVKNLSSCEIMGGANNICSDKTGTLTQNIMQVTALYVERNTIQNDVHTIKSKLNKNTVELMCESICYNSNAFPQKDKVTNKWIQIGNKTECALLECADNFNYNFSQYRPSDKILRQIPFNSKRKKMSTAVYNPKTQFVRVYTKGASEIVLNQCIKMVGANGVEQLLDQNARNQIYNDVIQKFASESLRTIAIAYRDLDPHSQNSSVLGQIPQLTKYTQSIQEDDLDKDLVLVAIAGIKDPIRPDVPNSIKQCHSSGVTVRMVTGDNILTATAIAKECGILQSNKQPGQYEVMEGKFFREFVGGLKTIGNKENFKVVARDMKVMARASPEDKYILVMLLQSLVMVLMMHQPQKKQMQDLLWVSLVLMLPRMAADIILLDDNFSSIITAMKWGRNIYDCIRKFIQFQLTVNLVALFMSFLGAVVLKESPLNTIEMLWVNLIMDTFASLALATEPPNITVLERQPYKREDKIVSPTMNRTIVGGSVYQIAVLCGILFVLPKYMDLSMPQELEGQKFHKNVVQMSIFFQTFVVMQVFNSITCRQLDYKTINPFTNACNNPLFWGVQTFTLIIQCILIQYGGKFVKVSHLTVQQHILCIGFGIGSIIFLALVKLVIPENFCQRVELFREDIITEDKMDDTLASRLRRKINYKTKKQKN
ncbi:unnamed protein product (macronuclear) [Paramecium tetraurelia]|uniref:Calcium-transporting ATPase n=1 Tax=Paramecium tetraurelia TaxID=5888 RepID=A0DB25_PARTE|nr:uncharacterized protein GSPATT00015136001 [Paramecium tetraurelia]CAK80242.1 unnamed protein product [Paramecium tetraurelia]|eukprot:XP_001447639.1 hypothetical protein (macronuclear) [Paramecium tetraurelia strain d4-2]